MNRPEIVVTAENAPPNGAELVQAVLSAVDREPSVGISFAAIAAALVVTARICGLSKRDALREISHVWDGTILQGAEEA